ncbi:uncharacterized protein K441DRAFT_654267 [Cenococcum geophilum 1.58]|uniref:uncharacterized protein n=1 Tax=Cenococcum geophilum 1.58 TaxID=794803 RepID=UPI00358E8B8D|nr:hypothetical protein K441DRAFT_654267 [Cenococcum geophilum 1.58]
MDRTTLLTPRQSLQRTAASCQQREDPTLLPLQHPDCSHRSWEAAYCEDHEP